MAQGNEELPFSTPTLVLLLDVINGKGTAAEKVAAVVITAMRDTIIDELKRRKNEQSK